MNTWIRQQPSRIHKPNAMEPSECEAMLASVNIGSLEAIEGLLIFQLKSFQVRSCGSFASVWLPRQWLPRPVTFVLIGLFAFSIFIFLLISSCICLIGCPATPSALQGTRLETLLRVSLSSCLLVCEGAGTSCAGDYLGGVRSGM